MKQDEGFSTLAKHMSSDFDDSRQDIVPKGVICLNLTLRPIVGVCMAVRGAYDGRFSFFGLMLSIVYFVSIAWLIFIDKRFHTMETYARLLPKLFAIVVVLVQLSGVLRVYKCSREVWQTCL